MSIAASVIIPVHNGRSTLRDCLLSVLDQDADEYEVIVVDDASDDGSDEIAAQLAERNERLRLLRLEHNGGPGRARNEAIRQARGDVLLLLDCDCTVERTWVRRHREAQQEARIVGGAVVGVHSSVFGRADGYCSWFDSMPDRRKTRQRRNHLPTANLGVARAVFERVGLFREGERLYSEDAEFCERAVRAGEELLFDPSIAARHQDRDGWRDFLRHQWTAGIQMINYRRESGAAYHWLMPRNRWTGWLLAAPLALAYTAYLLAKWVPREPRVVFYTPLIFAGKAAQSAAMAVYSEVPSRVEATPPSLPPRNAHRPLEQRA